MPIFLPIFKLHRYYMDISYVVWKHFKSVCFLNTLQSTWQHFPLKYWCDIIFPSLPVKVCSLLFLCLFYLFVTFLLTVLPLSLWPCRRIFCHLVGHQVRVNSSSWHLPAGEGHIKCALVLLLAKPMLLRLEFRVFILGKVSCRWRVKKVGLGVMI